MPWPCLVVFDGDGDGTVDVGELAMAAQMYKQRCVVVAQSAKSVSPVSHVCQSASQPCVIARVTTRT